jgi:energy-coupling factor transporter transmembrane protein EcfT
MPFSEKTLIDRTVYFAKLMCFIFMGLIFMSTTSAASIRGAVYSTIPSLKIALLITFLFAFIPLIFSVYIQTAKARKLRTPGRTANPVRTIVLSLRSFLAQILISGDSIADAYTLRCLSDKFSPPVKKIRWYDVFFLSCSLAFTVWTLYSHLFVYSR